MTFSKAHEYAKFRKNQEVLKKEYVDAGMTEEQIEDIQEFDQNQFARDVAYSKHTHGCSIDGLTDEEQAKMYDKFKKKYMEALSVEMDMQDASRYWWLEEIGNPQIAGHIKDLSAQEIEFLTMLVVDGFPQKEIAKRMNCSSSAISQRKAKIRKIFSAPV